MMEPEKKLHPVPPPGPAATHDAVPGPVSDEQPPLTEEDNRIARELSEKYGWEQFRKKP